VGNLTKRGLLGRRNSSRLERIWSKTSGEERIEGLKQKRGGGFCREVKRGRGKWIPIQETYFPKPGNAEAVMWLGECGKKLVAKRKGFDLRRTGQEKQIKVKQG